MGEPMFVSIAHLHPQAPRALMQGQPLRLLAIKIIYYYAYLEKIIHDQWNDSSNQFDNAGTDQYVIMPDHIPGI